MMVSEDLVFGSSAGQKANPLTTPATLLDLLICPNMP